MRPTLARSHGSRLAWIACAALGLSVWLASCVTPATEALIEVGTDIPSNRVVTVTATVTDTQAHVSNQAHWAFDAGRTSGPTRVASFAVVPGRGPRDAAVSVVLDALVLPLSPTDSTISLRRRMAFRLMPGRTIALSVFLSVQCLRPAVGCTSVPPDRCTRSVWCEDMGQTCGDQGQCVSTSIDHDAGLDAFPDVHADAAPECVPICAARNCGDDGCGGSCGTCASGTGCDILTGHCVCIPDCAGRDCGLDGCGGECGVCPNQFRCNGTMCVRLCGGPGQPCCSSAPACQSGLMCGPTSSCIGACGSAGTPCCGGSTCNMGLVCMAGTCRACSTGTPCGGTCVDLQTDPMNCGTCGSACVPGQLCASGRCTCPAGQTLCGGQCVNLATDEAHCGACGMACSTGMTCCSGSCVSIYTDLSNCGTCGHACGSGMVCQAGNCFICGGSYEACCAGGTCNLGYGCFFDPPAGMSCQPCGREGQSCCPGDRCLSGFNCNSTRTDIRYGCIRCGGGGENCCGSSGCSAGYACTVIIAGVTSLCTTATPGLPGSACTTSTDCSGNSFCRNGFCYACGGFDQFCCPNAPTGTCNGSYSCHQLGTTANYACW